MNPLCLVFGHEWGPWIVQNYWNHRVGRYRVCHRCKREEWA